MKEKFIKSTLILVIGGFITKLLSMIIRIITTRVIGIEGLGLLQLVNLYQKELEIIKN